MVFVERREYADDDDVDLDNQAVIGGGREAVLLGRLNFSSGNANDIRTADSAYLLLLESSRILMEKHFSLNNSASGRPR